jgi:hypothetical protein
VSEAGLYSSAFFMRRWSQFFFRVFLFFMSQREQIRHYIVRAEVLRDFLRKCMSETDKFYIERCLDGHPDDFRYLVRRYQAVLLAHLTGKLGSKTRADEAAQEVFVRAYFNMCKLKKPDSFFSWLLGIADRVAKEQRREEQIQRQREIVRSISEEAPRTELSSDSRTA